jgi:hypothetical protein
MLTVKKGDNEIKRGRQEKGFIADVLWILKAEHRLSGTLDWEDIYVSEFGIIHEMAPDLTHDSGQGIAEGK